VYRIDPSAEQARIAAVLGADLVAGVAADPARTGAFVRRGRGAGFARRLRVGEVEVTVR